MNNPKDLLKKGEALSDDALKIVSGGVKFAAANQRGSSVDPQVKYQEFEAAYSAMGFFNHGFTRHQMDAMCDVWEAQGFPGTAESFLASAKNW